VDVRRSFYCITTGAEVRALEGRQNTFWSEVFSAHISWSDCALDEEHLAASPSIGRRERSRQVGKF